MEEMEEPGETSEDLMAPFFAQVRVDRMSQTSHVTCMWAPCRITC